jgi:hypothetical protein
MKARFSIVSGLILGLTLADCLLGTAVRADESLPDASVVAFANHKSGKRSSGPKQTPPKVSEVTLTGVVDAVQANGLAIKAGKSTKGKDQKTWLVMPGQNVEVTIDGTATVDYLKKGQIVQFEGQVLNNEEVAGKLNELTVLDKKSSAALTAKVAARDHVKEVAGGGGGRIAAPKEDADSDALIGPDDSKKKGDAKASAKSDAAASGLKTKIVGKIESRTDKGFTVASGSRTLKVELSDSPTINVQLSDPKMVQVGARIVVHGTAAESKQGNQCMAKTIVVTLATPLSGKGTLPEKKKEPAAK